MPRTTAMPSSLALALHRPTRAGAMLATLLMLLACSGGTEPRKPEEHRTPVPTPLADAWHAGSVSSVNFFNSSTGHFSAPTGTGLFFRFHTDGSYEKGVL